MTSFPPLRGVSQSLTWPYIHSTTFMGMNHPQPFAVQVTFPISFWPPPFYQTTNTHLSNPKDLSELISPTERPLPLSTPQDFRSSPFPPVGLSYDFFCVLYFPYIPPLLPEKPNAHLALPMNRLPPDLSFF